MIVETFRGGAKSAQSDGANSIVAMSNAVMEKCDRNVA